MTWFTQFCRQSGLLIHQVLKPPKSRNRKSVQKKVEQIERPPHTTLRRTTIEEIEIRDDWAEASPNRSSEEGS